MTWPLPTSQAHHALGPLALTSRPSNLPSISQPRRLILHFSALSAYESPFQIFAWLVPSYLSGLSSMAAP